MGNIELFFGLETLANIQSPVKYMYRIYLRVGATEYVFYKYTRDGYPCAHVRASSYGENSRNTFLLRTDGEFIWWGDFSVAYEEVVKEIDGIVYRGKKELPTEWDILDVPDSQTKETLMYIIKQLWEVQ